MRAKPIALIAAVTLIAGAASAAAPPAAWRLSSDGYGPVLIGMTEAQATKALGSALDSDKPPASAGAQELADWRACHQAQAKDAPGLFLMFENGRLTSVWVDEGSHVVTTAGLGVGDTEARVKRTYGAALKIEPNAYEEPPAHYLTVKGGKPGRGVKFTTDKSGKVTSIAGGGASIGYSEGCA